MNETKKTVEHEHAESFNVIAETEAMSMAKIKEALVKRQRPTSSYIDPKDEANETDWDN